MVEQNIKRYDIIIYGASGFTGRYVMEELCNSLESDSIKWAIAGRNVKKLKESLLHVQKYLDENMDIQNIPIICADAHDPISLYEMCKNTKLVINCVGPYTLYGGESVVAACIECGTHHIDISAELKYLENIQVKYFNQAREKNVYIIEACGFGSMPADYGISLLKQKFPGGINDVEYYVKIGEGPEGRTTNIGTLLSGIHSVKDHIFHSKYDKSLKEIFKKEIPHNDFPLKTRWPPLFYSTQVNGLCYKYLGPDERVLNRSQLFRQEYLNDRPIQFQGYFQLPSLGKSLLYALLIFLFLIFSLFSKGQKLMSKYPGFLSAGQFSNSGPSRKQVCSGSTKITLFGKGWKTKSEYKLKPDSKIKLTISGPEAAYPFTAMCMVQAALVVLQEKDKLPLEGGVLTPGVAFEFTSLHERLAKRGMKFEFQDEY